MIQTSLQWKKLCIFRTAITQTRENISALNGHAANSWHTNVFRLISEYSHVFTIDVLNKGMHTKITIKTWFFNLILKFHAQKVKALSKNVETRMDLYNTRIRLHTSRSQDISSHTNVLRHYNTHHKLRVIPWYCNRNCSGNETGWINFAKTCGSSTKTSHTAAVCIAHRSELFREIFYTVMVNSFKVLWGKKYYS